MFSSFDAVADVILFFECRLSVYLFVCFHNLVVSVGYEYIRGGLVG